MTKKSSIWGVLVAPWAPHNTYRLAFYVLLGTIFLFAFIWMVRYLQSGQIPSIPSWWFVFSISLSIFFLFISLTVSVLVHSIGKNLPKDASLQSHCRMIHGTLETPGIAQITHDSLILKPLLGKQVLISLRDISAIEEYHWYNSCPYLGKAVFFKLTVPNTVSNKWRLGFGVEDGTQWRELLYARKKTT